MEIIIEFDYIQQDLMGENKMLTMEDGATLRDLLVSVDTLIENVCASKGREPGQLKTLKADGSLNSCIASVNGKTPSDLLEHRLNDGDHISLLYGFCGG